MCDVRPTLQQYLNYLGHFGQQEKVERFFLPSVAQTHASGTRFSE